VDKNIWKKVQMLQNIALPPTFALSLMLTSKLLFSRRMSLHWDKAGLKSKSGQFGARLNVFFIHSNLVGVDLISASSSAFHHSAIVHDGVHVAQLIQDVALNAMDTFSHANGIFL